MMTMERHGADGAGRRGGWGIGLLLLVVYYAYAFVRTPQIMGEGRFWAEEAIIYFVDAVQHGLASFGHAHLGYYSLWNKIAAYAATTVPLEFAALVTVHFAFAVQFCVLLLIWFSDLFRAGTTRVLAALVFMVAFPDNEVWLNTINSQFYFALGCAVLLAARTDAIPAVPRRLFLIVAGLTGPVSVFLTPFFALRALVDRDWQRAVDAAVLAVCAVGQVLILASLSGGREISLNLEVLAALMGLSLGVTPIAGLGVTTALASYMQTAPDHVLPLGVTLVALAVGVLATVCGRSVAARWLVLAAAWLCLLSHLGALGGLTPELLYPMAGGRYAYATLALVGLAFVAALGPIRSEGAVRWVGWDKARVAVAAVLVAVYLGHGLWHVTSDPTLLDGPSWPEAVAAWRHDPSVTRLSIWPPGWAIDDPDAIFPRTPPEPLEGPSRD